ncbi:MAG: HesA/MoeB/ThiF family protein [Alphaproteobacteria bacterium]|nr:HesA/MoeB/ThiF family protein [Alphaproteobacteria bacterium]
MKGYNVSTSERYERHIVVKEIGGGGQQALAAAKVAIVGLGGLGNPLAQYLVAAGVGTGGDTKGDIGGGKIGLIDDDVVELSNLQRQILFCEADIGKPKVQCAAARLKALNSDCHIITHQCRLTPATADILEDYDIIADASDNFTTRFLINDICQLQSTGQKKVLVSAACTQFAGHITTFTPQSGLNYRDFVPEAPAPQDNHCATQGIIGAVAGVVGSLQALEIIKEITKAGESLAGRVLIYDGLAATTRLVQLSPDKNLSPPPTHNYD